MPHLPYLVASYNIASRHWKFLNSLFDGPKRALVFEPFLCLLLQLSQPLFSFFMLPKQLVKYFTSCFKMDLLWLGVEALCFIAFSLCSLLNFLDDGIAFEVRWFESFDLDFRIVINF